MRGAVLRGRDSTSVREDASGSGSRRLGCLHGRLCCGNRGVDAEILAARAKGGDAIETIGDIAGVLAGASGDTDVDVRVTPADFLAGCTRTTADCIRQTKAFGDPENLIVRSDTILEG